MEGFLSRFRNSLVLIVVLTIQTILLAVQVRRPDYGSRADGKHVRLVRYWGVALVAPFERMSLFVGHGVRGMWGNYADLRGVRQQNKDLKSRIDQLLLERTSLEEDARQGKRLQTLLEFKQQYIKKTVAAQVLGTSGSDQSYVLLIDKGADAGLQPDMAVITPDGIVGKVRDVFPHSAQVLAINDQTAGAGVVLETTRIRGILRGGTDGTLRIANVLIDSRIKPGEHIVTSGGDQVFPRGLNVGVIENVSNDHDHVNYALIKLKPAANLARLEEVLVITEKEAQLPEEQQMANAESNKAADIREEKLPQVKEGDAQEQSKAAVPVAVPKPLPAVRPDRYSPGASPAAVELKPGARHAPDERPAQTPVGPADGGAPK